LSHPLLTAPIGRSLLRLASPTTALMAVQIVVGIAETWFIARLGADALAGFALVLPFLVLMYNTANGGMGGGVASAFARALGGERLEDARALVLHTLVLAAALGLLFAILAWTIAPSLYRLMGGSGLALERALAFSNVIFGGALVVWTSAFLAALLRGAGDPVTPGRYGLFTSIAYVPLAGVLTLGLGDWPGFGMMGPGLAGIVTMGAMTVLLARAVWRVKLGVVPRLGGVKLERRLFGEILRVGVVSSFTTLVASLAALLMTGLVGRFGVDALAGYGVGLRLEYMVAPLAYGIGTGLTTMVGVASGADDWKRAMRVAWIGGDRAAGGCCERLLSPPRGAVLLPVWAGPGALLRRPGRGARHGAGCGRHRACRGCDGRRLVRGRKDGPGPRRRLHGDGGGYGGLWLRNRRVALHCALAIETYLMQRAQRSCARLDRRVADLDYSAACWRARASCTSRVTVSSSSVHSG
jgi:hypothetical protein